MGTLFVPTRRGVSTLGGVGKTKSVLPTLQNLGITACAILLRRMPIEIKVKNIGRVGTLFVPTRRGVSTLDGVGKTKSVLPTLQNHVLTVSYSPRQFHRLPGFNRSGNRLKRADGIDDFIGRDRVWRLAHNRISE